MAVIISGSERLTQPLRVAAVRQGAKPVNKIGVWPANTAVAEAVKVMRRGGMAPTSSNLPLHSHGNPDGNDNRDATFHMSVGKGLTRIRPNYYVFKDVFFGSNPVVI